MPRARRLRSLGRRLIRSMLHGIRSLPRVPINRIRCDLVCHCNDRLGDRSVVLGGFVEGARHRSVTHGPPSSESAWTSGAPSRTLLLGSLSGTICWTHHQLRRHSIGGVSRRLLERRSRWSATRAYKIFREITTLPSSRPSGCSGQSRPPSTRSRRSFYASGEIRWPTISARRKRSCCRCSCAIDPQTTRSSSRYWYNTWRSRDG